MNRLAIVIIFLSLGANAQMVKLIPQTLTAEDSVEIIYDATKGTQGLVGATSVYIHTGVVITNTNTPTANDWKYVVGNWGKDDGIGKMSKVMGTTDQWKIKLSPSIRKYYKVPAGESIYKLALVFRNADGSKEGKGIKGDFAGGTVTDNGDIFLNISSAPYISISILSPTENNIFFNTRDSIRFLVTTSTNASSIVLFLKENNGSFQEVKKTDNARTIRLSKYISHSIKITFKVEAHFGETIINNMKDFFVNVRPSNTIEALPSGVKSGINYNSSDSTKAILVLQAPKKQFAYVVGDFTNWQVEDKFLMKQTPDSQYFWLEITELQPKKEYAYQYWVDGTLKIGDPYSDRVVDSNNDKYILDSLHILKIPTGLGIASVLQTGQVPFQWEESENNWVKPIKEELIIYELLIRDFVKTHSYKTLIDTLPYLKKLGVNAIELMPIMEFEGNESWGYNPIYHMAVDKYYGTKNELKRFIQEAHKQGFAVLLDMVLNHAFGQSPLVLMYWDAQNNKPSHNNPWFNTDAPHPYNVGYDFNHESSYTQSFVDDVNKYWLKEFHFDGYRFDLTKGFTNKTSTEQTAANYDASRISILKRMATKIFTHTHNAYIILEHFAEEQEEKELSGAGMLLWANGSYSYGDLLLGKTSANLSFVNNKTKVSYMESHDEERLMYKALNSLEGNAAYYLKNKSIAMNRIKALTSFFYTVPGPKMMWQFQELGYDISINFNGRLGNKPLPWGNGGLGYYENNERQKLFKTHAAIINLVKEYRTAFTEGKFTWTFSGDTQTTEVKHSSIVIEHPSLSVVIVANFTTNEVTARIPLPKIATWYDFFFKDANINPITTNDQIKLYPGEFHIFLDRRVNFPETGLVNIFKPLVTVEPYNFTAQDSVLLTFQPTYSPDTWTLNGEKCYMVAGVVTSPTGNRLEYIKGAGNNDDGKGLMATLKTSPVKYSILFNPREYFQVNESIPIYKIGLFFRNADGTKLAKGIDGDTIFLKVNPEGKIVTIQPEKFGVNTEIKIIFDAFSANNDGTAGLVNAKKVYMHAGIITTSAQGTSWEYVVGNWGKDDNRGQMTKVPNELNKWQITLIPQLYFTAVPQNTNWFRIGMVFRNEDGSARGKGEGASDIFVNFDPGIKPDPFSPTITSVEEKHIDNTIHIFPNPAKRKIFFQLENNSFFTIQSIHLFDINGIYVKTNIFVVNDMIEMDISHINVGIYFVSVLLNDTTVIKKIYVE